jgi:hypothetical protein
MFLASLRRCGPLRLSPATPPDLSSTGRVDTSVGLIRMHYSGASNCRERSATQRIVRLDPLCCPHAHLEHDRGFPGLRGKCQAMAIGVPGAPRRARPSNTSADDTRAKRRACPQRL